MSGKRSRKRAQVPRPGSSPLFLVAGLPGSTALGVTRLVEGLYNKPCAVQTLAAGTSDKNIYDKKYIDNLMKLAATFAEKRRTGSQNRPPTPAFLYLFYVPAPDDENLLQAFDFAVFPVPLRGLDAFGIDGKRFRHNQEAVKKMIAGAISQVAEARVVRDRIALARTTEALLLPPLNFHVSRTDRLKRLFLDIRKGERNWDDRLSELSVEEFNSETLVPLYGKGPQRHFRDAREIVFFKPAPSGYHGAQWDSQGISPELARRILRSLYRFGAPLPQGFQHDAQFEKPKAFAKQAFECCEKGDVLVTASHANVYPDDFVRAEGLIKKN